MNVARLLQVVQKLLPATSNNNLVKEYELLFFENNRVSATNGRLRIWLDLPEPIEGPAFAVEAVALQKFLKSLDEPEINLVVNLRDMLIETEQVRGNIATFDPSRLLGVGGRPALEMHKDPSLKRALSLCAASTSKDASQGIITGVCVHKNFCVGFDHYRATVATFDNAWPYDTVVLSGDLVDYVNKNVSNEACFAYDDGIVYFELLDSEGMVIGLVGGQVLPGDYKADRLIARAEPVHTWPAIPVPLEMRQALAKAVKRQNAMQADQKEYVRESTISVEPEFIELRSASGTRGVVREKVERTDGGQESFDFAVNPVFLAKLSADVEKLYYSAPDRCLAFTGPGYVHMIMTKSVVK